MNGPAAHDRAQLGAYAIGALDPVEARMVQGHLAGCPDCQREVNELMMIRRALDQVPPEAFLDGPPDNGDLLLRRTLRRVATEVGTEQPRKRSAAVFVAAAAAVAVALGGGVFLGRETAPSGQKVAGPTVTVSPTPTNARHAESTDRETGAAMQVALEPKKGWVWVHATAQGLPVNEPCELIVHAKNGEEVSAGTWLVSEEGAKESRMEGMALVSPDEVESVEIRTMSGDKRTVVEVPF